jgi:type I restriction enzyme R subunit
MYVDKKLRDVAAVQTLSRLNRMAPGKQSTFVLDFVNTDEEIKQAFLPYYEQTTMAGDTDPNKVYDIRLKLREYGLYDNGHIGQVNALMAKHHGGAPDPTALGKLSSIFQPIIALFKDLAEEDRNAVRDLVRKFNRAYSYVTQLVQIHDRELFEEYQFTLHLARLLPSDNVERVDLDDKVRLEYMSLTETFKGAIILNEKAAPMVPDNKTTSKKSTKKYDVLQSIMDKVNERFAGHFTENERVVVEGIYKMMMKSDDVKHFKRLAQNNSTEMFVKSLFPDKFKEVLTRCFMENNETYQRIFTDTDFYATVQDAMAREIYKVLRKTYESEEIESQALLVAETDE